MNALPQRFTYSDRIQNFATEKSIAILSEAKNAPQEFITKLGFDDSSVECINLTDGLRIILLNGDVIHLRPSGNAPELRCYAESNKLEQSQYFVENILNKIQDF